MVDMRGYVLPREPVRTRAVNPPPGGEVAGPWIDLLLADTAEKGGQA